MKTSIVDSFTHEHFKGNPAGVCFPEKEISDEKMLHDCTGTWSFGNGIS